jgi:hypothetical protein
MAIKHIWSCTCGKETTCRAEDQQLGAVFQCPECKTVWGCVRPKIGGKAWVAIDAKDVEFHGLIAEPEDA